MKIMKYSITLINVIINLGVFLVLLTLFFALGPLAETVYWPPARIELKKESDDGKVMTFEVTGIKTRYCKFEDVSVLVRNNNIWSQGAIAFDNLKTGTQSRPIGVQSFGKWFISPVGDAVNLEAHHYCHPLWTTNTEISWAT